MHVLVIPSWFAQYEGDPSGSFFATQAAGIQDLGLQVGILFPDLRSVRQARRYVGGKTAWSASGAVNVLRHSYVNWTPRIEPLILPRWIAVGMRLFDQYCARFGKPDVIHAHCLLRAGVLAARLSRKHGIPFVVTEHSSRWHRHEVSPYELAPARAAAREAHALVCVSQALLSHVKMELDPVRTHVVPNAVDPLFLASAPAGRPQGAGSAFINVALLNPGKRHDLLIDAFVRAFGKDTANTLCIVGDGPQRQALEQQIAGYGMQSSIRLAGMQPKETVATMLAAADCFVLSSDHETFGVVVTEALAMGLPVLSTRCGGTDEIITPANGMLVEAGKSEALAQGLAAMRQRLELACYDRDQIRADCRARYGQAAVCGTLATIFADAVRQPEAAAAPADSFERSRNF